MKVTAAVITTNQKTCFTPPIPLERPEKKELQKGEYLVLKLKSLPSDKDSQTYELSIPYFSTGTPEEWFRFQRDLNRVIVGQGLKDGPAKFAMARRLLEGDALMKFQERAAHYRDESDENYSKVLKEVAEHVLPKKALAYQKRYMRRFMRKPQNMKIRLFIARVKELNEYLKLFPPFADSQAIEEDELKDIFKFTIPNKWRNQATVQGFDILSHTHNEFIEFCERLELIEEQNPEESPKKPKDDKSKGGDTKKHGKDPKKRGRDGEKTCILHGPGHSTDKCKTLLHQAKRMKQTYEAQTPKGKWELRKKEELNSLVEAVIGEIRAKKKRKISKEDSDNELNMNSETFSSLSLSDDSDDE